MFQIPGWRRQVRSVTSFVRRGKGCPFFACEWVISSFFSFVLSLFYFTSMSHLLAIALLLAFFFFFFFLFTHLFVVLLKRSLLRVTFIFSSLSLLLSHSFYLFVRAEWERECRKQVSESASATFSINHTNGSGPHLCYPWWCHVKTSLQDTWRFHENEKRREKEYTSDEKGEETGDERKRWCNENTHESLTFWSFSCEYSTYASLPSHLLFHLSCFTFASCSPSLSSRMLCVELNSYHERKRERKGWINFSLLLTLSSFCQLQSTCTLYCEAIALRW